MRLGRMQDRLTLWQEGEAPELLWGEVGLVLETVTV